MDNEDNFSHIHHIQATINPDWDNFQPVFNTWYRYREKNLFTYANIRNPDESFQFYSFSQPDTLSSSEFYVNLRTFSYNLLRQESSYKIINFENEIKQRYLILNQSIRQTRFLPALNYRFYFADNKNSNEIPEESNNLINTSTSKITIHEPQAEYRYQVFSMRGNARFYKNTVNAPEIPLIISGNKLNQYTTEFALDNIYNSGVAVSYSNENNLWLAPQGLILDKNFSSFDKEIRDYSVLNSDSWEQLRKSETWTIQSYSRINRQFITALYSHRVVHSNSEEVNVQKFDIAELRSMNSVLNNGLQMNISYILRNTEFFPKARELNYVGQGAGFYDSTGVWTENGDYDWVTVIIGDPSKSIEVQANLNAFMYPANIISREHDFVDFLNKINFETNISILEQTENKDRIKVYFLLPEAIMNDLSIYSQQEFRQSIWYNIQRNRWISRYTFRNNKTQDRRFQDLQTYSFFEHEISLRLLRFYNSDFEKIFRYNNQTDSRYDMESDTWSSELNVRTNFGNNLIFSTGLGYEQENVISRLDAQTIERFIFSEDIMYFLGQRYRFNTNVSVRYNVVDDPISTFIPFDKQQGLNLRWVASVNYRMNRIATMNLDYSGYKHPTQEAFHQVRMEVRAEF